MDGRRCPRSARALAQVRIEAPRLGGASRPGRGGEHGRPKRRTRGTAGNGWKVILARCAPIAKPRSIAQLMRKLNVQRRRARLIYFLRRLLFVSTSLGLAAWRVSIAWIVFSISATKTGSFGNTVRYSAASTLFGRFSSV